MTLLAPRLSTFFAEHLPRERQASPHTVAAYAQAFTLFIHFAAERLDRRPSDLRLEDLGPDMVLSFLDHIEARRANSARSRNARLAAIRAFFRYIEYREPAHLEQALRIRALPAKRVAQRLVDHLSREEIAALLAAPDQRTPGGVRDRAMLHLAYAAGLRVAELLSLRLDDFPDRSLATVRILGKGRRERVLPLWRETREVIRRWLALRPAGRAPELFLNRDGGRMSRDGFAHRLGKHVATAVDAAPSLSRKRVTPHVLRHSCAMHTLAATGDIRKVALWLGHASIQSTEAYLRADPAEKLAVLGVHAPPGLRPGRFRPPMDPLLAMLAERRAAL
jgi:site-specific recombinase XerD